MSIPNEPQIKNMLQEVARGLDQIFNGEARGQERKTGFVLLVFPYGHGDDHRCNYVSNGADRKDIVAFMRETINRFENPAMPDDQKGHA